MTLPLGPVSTAAYSQEISATEDHVQATTDATQAIGTQSATQGLHGEQHYVHTAKICMTFADVAAEYKDVPHPHVNNTGPVSLET